MWYEKYLSIPFVPDTTSMDACDCAGLIFLVLKNELGFEVKRDNTVKCDARQKHILMKQYLPLVDEVEISDIRPLDIFFQAEGHCWHTGVVVDSERVIESTLERGVKLRNINEVLARPTKFYRVKP